MREQLDGGDIGVSIGDAAGHQGSGVGLGLGDRAQARHEIPDRQGVQREPAQKRCQQPQIEAAHDEHHRDEIDQHEHQDVGQQHPGIAHRQSGLHDFGRYPAGEFILVEAQALRQHVAMKIPAQPHGEIAGKRLLLEQTLQGDEGRAPHENHGQHDQVSALLRPQRRGLNFGQPVDDVTEHAEQHRLEYADHDGAERHGRDIAPRAARTSPDEGEEPVRQRCRRSVGIG